MSPTTLINWKTVTTSTKAQEESKRGGRHRDPKTMATGMGSSKPVLIGTKSSPLCCTGPRTQGQTLLTSSNKNCEKPAYRPSEAFLVASAKGSIDSLKGHSLLIF